jgi:broad specificity phosphatase PhoE
LIRHGPTDWNAEGRFQGQTDVPLSEGGRRDARAIATALRDDRVRIIYSSELSRAVETAKIIAAQSGAAVITDARLREFDFGRWEGLTWRQILEQNAELRNQLPTAARYYTPAGGESFPAVCRRAQSFLDDLTAQSRDDGVTAVVTHAGVLHAMLAVLQLNGSESFEQTLSFTPGSITRIEIGNGTAQIISLNEVRHLKRVP